MNKKSLCQLHPLRIDVILLMIISAVFLFIGLHTPVMTVRKLWEKNTFSIWSGVTNLWIEKYYGLAALIFFFSIVFPILKLAALAVTWFLPLSDSHRKGVLQGLELLGRWSMLDVFVIAILIVSVKLGALATTKAETGIYYFGASILSAMLTSAFQNHLARAAR